MLKRIQLREKYFPESREVRKFLVIFYIIGIVGFLIPFSANFFLELTKWALIMNFGLLFLFHSDYFDNKTSFVFLGVFVSTFIIEAVGVNSGLIFGEYEYGEGLGIKFFNTPLLIGLNWLMLSYCFASVTIKLSAVIRIIIASAGMLIYDVVMEQSAAMLNMWSWDNDTIPLRNYIAWFIIAFIIQGFFVLFKVKCKNPLAKTILICQFAFFFVLYIYKNLFP